MAGHVPNVCAGPFGAFYDFYIERPRLMQVVGRSLWGIDASVLYASMKPIEEAGSGAVIADVPCGGGVALRRLSPDQEVRYIAADLSPKMLRRAQRRAAERSLRQVETMEADMTDLPLADEEVDLFLSFSGLHMIPEPERAVAEIARCLKPGGEVIGTTFLSDGSLRARALFKAGSYRGHAVPPERALLKSWLEQAGLVNVHLGPQSGFTSFQGQKPTV
ncbi:MAG TPA: class I SAM-dependent methyltransferase [Solirubrobacterales bacterium]|nr:class I SAM-dependent methyltransferase [Solirubrobacterales bacterium]